MLNELRIDRDRIALEAHLAQNLSALLKNTFPSIYEGFAGFVGQVSASTPAVALTSFQQRFINDLLKHKYSDISPLRAFVPEGLDVSYLHYLQRLAPAVEHACEAPRRLADFTTFVSQLITNTQDQLSTKDTEPYYKQIDLQRKSLNKGLGDCFKLGSTKTEVSIADVVDRNNDWRDVFVLTDELVNKVNAIDRAALNKKATETAALLHTLKNKIERGELDGVSAQVVEGLANGAYSAASELEMFAAIYYKTAALSTSINRTVEHFKKTFTM